MANNVTISQMPSWHGDTSMRLHAHKPGTSEAVSIKDIADLVTTGEGLQTGDVVLRPVGTYSDAYECNGSIHQTADSPVLAGKLNFPNFGTQVQSINFNSEVRFGTVQQQQVKKLGSLIVSSGIPTQIYKNKVLLSSISNYTVDTIFKTSKALYCKKSSSSNLQVRFVRINIDGVLEFYSPNASYDIQSVVDYTSTEDLIFFHDGSYLQALKINPSSTAVGALYKTNIAGFSGKFNIVKSSGIYFASTTFNGVSGIYKIGISDSTFTAELVYQNDTAVCAYANDNFVYLKIGNTGLRRMNPLTYELFDIPVPSGAVFLDVIFDQNNMIGIRRSTSLKSVFSFDGGQTWSDGPAMSAYYSFDYDTVSGEFCFVGGNGTSGSVAGQTGSIQTNSANFPNDTIFRVPNISSPVANFKQYITR